MDVLKNLKLDQWYMVLMALGAVVFVLAITVQLQVPNAPVALIALGMFFVGLGEWRNHPYQARIEPGMGMLWKVSGHPRSASALGLLFDALGLLLGAVGLYRLLWGE